MTPDHSSTPAQARDAYRGGLVRPTVGIAAGFAQANLVSVPRELAYDLLLFTQRNPKPCPVLDVTEPGSWTTPVAPGADLRTDLPRYRIWRHGELTEEPNELLDDWRADLVTFLIGCSFTFEETLQQAGVPVRHIDQGVNVPMYRTNRATRSAGRLHGDLVVSMRPIPAEQVADAVRITAAVPAVHGAPVHVGDPARLGIADLDRPDFGEAVQIQDGDIPVFWACGVTPQVAIMASRPPFAITHAPGHMFLTDLTDAELRTR